MKKLLLAVLFLTPLLALAQVGPTGGYTSTWAIQAQPAAATAATVTRAAVTGQRQVATSITVCVSAVAAQPTLVFNLRDGTTGAGTILWSGRLMAVIGDGNCITLSNLAIVGTVGNAMTLESAAAPAATNFATVSLTGFSIGKRG